VIGQVEKFRGIAYSEITTVRQEVKIRPKNSYLFRTYLSIFRCDIRIVFVEYAILRT